MNIALHKFQCLVSIWSFECLQVLTMAPSNLNVDENENESCEFIFKVLIIIK